MAQFPIREAKVLSLRDSLINGLEGNTAIYPSACVTTVNLQTALDAANAPKVPGPTRAWPWKPKPCSTTKPAAKNGNTLSLPSTELVKAKQATPLWRCCEALALGLSHQYQQKRGASNV